MCTIKLQIYIMISKQYILMNTMNYQMLKEVKWTTNLILLNYFLKTYNYDVWFENEQSTDKIY